MVAEPLRSLVLFGLLCIGCEVSDTDWFVVRGAGSTCLGPSYEGSITISGPNAEYEANRFCSTWSSVEGDLEIRNTPFETLEALGCLCEVEGWLTLVGNLNLRSVHGLEQLRGVGSIGLGADPEVGCAREDEDGNCEVTTTYLIRGENPLLENLTAMSDLHEVRCILTHGNDGRHLSQLTGLQSVSGSMLIDSTAELDVLRLPPNLEEFVDLRVIQGQSLRSVEWPADAPTHREPVACGWLNSYGQTYGHLFVNIDSVQHISDVLPSYSTLPQLVVVGADELQSISGLESLRTVDQDLAFVETPMLSDMAPLGRLEHVGNRFQLGGSDAPMGIEQLTGFESLRRVGRFSILGNDQLRTVSGFPALDEVDTSVIIEGNPALITLGGLDSIKHIPGELVVRDNPLLASFDGLGSLERVDGSVAVVNSGWSGSAGPAALASMGSLTLRGNRILTSLSGFDGVQEIRGDALVLDNPILSRQLVDAWFYSVPRIDGAMVNEGNGP